MTPQSDDFIDFPEITGKTVASAHFDKDESGYPFVKITFTDGYTFIVSEVGQCGDICVSGKPNP
jgi:hypothetical protein